MSIKNGINVSFELSDNGNPNPMVKYENNSVVLN